MEAFRQYRRLARDAHSEKLEITSSAASDQNQHEDSDNESLTVAFGDRDRNDPKQWTLQRKLGYTSIIWLLVFITGWSSSADSTAHEVTARYMHVSEVSESLAVSMYLFGIAVGAIFAGPCAETVGRLVTYLGTFFVYLIWTLASALAPNFTAQIIFRGFAGLFASASMSIYGGSLADMFEPEVRAVVWPFFALSPLLGPTIAPIVNGWITQNLGWRWDDWLTLILSGTIFLVAVCFLPETYSPLILSFKASLLREATQTSNFTSEFDQGQNVSARLLQNLRLICHFIFREATTLLFGLYLTLLYLLIYGFLEGFDFIFTKTYGFDVGQRYTAFASIAIGILIGLPYVVLINTLKSRQTTTGESIPEQRLLPSLLASPLLAISLFWIAWTDRPEISFFSILGACCLFGFSLMALFTSTYHYLIDTYGIRASNALSAITFMRYLASGGMVIATEPIYYALTVKWTLTMFGCVAAVLTPVPWIFWWYGAQIRGKSPEAKS